jgi:hypothetical protein
MIPRSILVALLTLCARLVVTAEDADVESLSNGLTSALAAHKKAANAGDTKIREKAKRSKPGAPLTAIVSRKRKSLSLGKYRFEAKQTVEWCDYQGVKLSACGANWYYYTTVEAQPSKPVPIADAERALQNDPTQLGKALLLMVQRTPAELLEKFKAHVDPADLSIGKIEFYAGPYFSLSGYPFEEVCVRMELRTPARSAEISYRIFFVPKTLVWDLNKSGQQLNFGRPDFELRDMEPSFDGGSW